MSKNYCKTIPITCCKVLNSSPGCLDLGGLGFKSPVVQCTSPPDGAARFRIPPQRGSRSDCWHGAPVWWCHYPSSTQQMTAPRGRTRYVFRVTCHVMRIMPLHVTRKIATWITGGSLVTT